MREQHQEEGETEVVGERRTGQTEGGERVGGKREGGISKPYNYRK